MSKTISRVETAVHCSVKAVQEEEVGDIQIDVLLGLADGEERDGRAIIPGFGRGKEGGVVARVLAVHAAEGIVHEGNEEEDLGLGSGESKESGYEI